MIWPPVFTWLSVLTTLSLPWVWLAAWMIDGRRRSKYFVSLIYLLLSWMMIVVAFAWFIDNWGDLMSLPPFLAEEVANSPLWARVSYDLFDRFLGSLPTGYLVSICSLPALLIPLIRVRHLRRRHQDALAFRYAAFNVAYFWLPAMAAGPTLIAAAYVRLGSYVLLLLAHWFVRPTAVWTARIWSAPSSAL